LPRVQAEIARLDTARTVVHGRSKRCGRRPERRSDGLASLEVKGTSGIGRSVTIFGNCDSGSARPLWTDQRCDFTRGRGWRTAKGLRRNVGSARTGRSGKGRLWRVTGAKFLDFPVKRHIIKTDTVFDYVPRSFFPLLGLSHYGHGCRGLPRERINGIYGRPSLVGGSRGH
jgi:hypothetical protein